MKTSFYPRTHLMIGGAALAILVLGFGSWSVLTEISGAVVASGKIEVEQNRQVVQHPDGGVVKAISVHDGDEIAAGELLMRLDPVALRSELAIVEGQLFEVMARHARLEAEQNQSETITFDPLLISEAETRLDVAELMAGQRNLFHARSESAQSKVKQLEKRQVQIREQLVGVAAQIEAVEAQIELVADELKDQESLLSRGLTQIARVGNLRREKAALKGMVGELMAARAQHLGQITELDIQIKQVATDRREEAISELRDIGASVMQLQEQRRSILDRLDRLDIRAPVAGVVYGMTVFAERSVLRPADPVLYVIPQDRPLIITAQVPTIHVDNLMIGQDVALRFSAFDQRETPELFGSVQKISADAFEDEQTRASYYQIEVTLNDGEAERLPEKAQLVPGMPVEVFIQTGSRTPLAYLTKPLTDYFTKAFREN